MPSLTLILYLLYFYFNFGPRRAGACWASLALAGPGRVGPSLALAGPGRVALAGPGRVALAGPRRVYDYFERGSRDQNGRLRNYVLTMFYIEWTSFRNNYV